MLGGSEPSTKAKERSVACWCPRMLQRDVQEGSCGMVRALLYILVYFIPNLGYTALPLSRLVPRRCGGCPSVPREAFAQLLPLCEAAIEAARAVGRLEGQPRTVRRLTVSTHGPLPPSEDGCAASSSLAHPLWRGCHRAPPPPTVVFHRSLAVRCVPSLLAMVPAWPEG